MLVKYTAPPLVPTASLSGFPIPPAAGIAVATGLNNIRKIAQVKAPGDASGGTTPSISARPQINGGIAAANALGVTAGNNVVTPETVTKTYVVAEDVSSAQEANKRVNDLARL